MALYNSFDRTQHLGELNTPLIGTNLGTITPAQRKRLVLANLGLLSAANQANVPATVSAVNVTATLTTAQMLGGIITSTTAAAVAATLPLGTAMETALAAIYGTLAVGDSFEFEVVNTGANAWTLTAATGFTIVGVAAVAATSQGQFRALRTAANTYVAYRIG